MMYNTLWSLCGGKSLCMYPFGSTAEADVGESAPCPASGSEAIQVFHLLSISGRHSHSLFASVSADGRFQFDSNWMIHNM